MDSSRELTSIYAIGFVVRVYLIFLIGVQTLNMTGLKFSPLIQIGPYSSSKLGSWWLHSFHGPTACAQQH
jgi:hypothetical protein